MLECSRCLKRLSKKRARMIDGKVLCSSCVFPVYCKDCGKPKGYKGFAGPECQCSVKLGHPGEGSHAAGICRTLSGSHPTG